jgi:hypothetical protein
VECGYICYWNHPTLTSFWGIRVLSMRVSPREPQLVPPPDPRPWVPEPHTAGSLQGRAGWLGANGKWAGSLWSLCRSLGRVSWRGNGFWPWTSLWLPLPSRLFAVEHSQRQRNRIHWEKNKDQCDGWLLPTVSSHLLSVMLMTLKRNNRSRQPPAPLKGSFLYQL